MSERNEFLARYGDSDSIHNALDHKDPNVRIAAMDNPFVTKDHIDKALNDRGEVYVRMRAMDSSAATSEHITKALKDDHPLVRRLAINNPNAGRKHLQTALGDSDNFVRKYAVELDKKLNKSNE